MINKNLPDNAQKVFTFVRNDYSNFLRLYREHIGLLSKLELLEAQLQDVIAIPCGGCGHTFNNCPELKLKQSGKQASPLSPREVVDRLFKEIKAYLEAYNQSTEGSPVSASLMADNSILFCKLQKTETGSTHNEFKNQDTASLSTKAASTKKGAYKPKQAKPTFVTEEGEAEELTSHPLDIDLSSISPPAPGPTKLPVAASSIPGQTPETKLQIKGAGNKTYFVRWDGPLNQYGLPYGPGQVIHQGVRYFSDWGTCRWGTSPPFLRSKNDTTTENRDMIYYPDGSVFVGVLGNSYGRLFFKATGTLTFPDGRQLRGNWDPDDQTFAPGEKEYVKNPGEFLPDFS